MKHLAIRQKAIALVLVMFGAMPKAGRADYLAGGVRPGECYRSGLMSTACAQEAPQHFNRVEHDQKQRVRSR